MKGNDGKFNTEWDSLRQRIESRKVRSTKGAHHSRERVSAHISARKASTGPLESPQAPKKINVSLNLTVPRVRLTEKHKKAGMVSVVVLIVGLVGFISYKQFFKPDGGETGGVLSEAAVQPEFDTVLPNGKTGESEDSKIKYDPKRKVASFKDRIGGVEVTISQQPLPDAFKANPDEEVKKIAESFSATEVINADNPKAYLGNDVKGPQTVIFHKDDVLVFILSLRPIPKEQWTRYITSLQ